jgi:membrane-associated phospholipid phosphatase
VSDNEQAPAVLTHDIAPRPVRRWRARLFQGYLVTATIAFTVLVVLATQFDYFSIDLLVTRGVQNYTALWFRTLMVAISFVGYEPQAWIMLGIAVLLLWAFGLRWEGVMTLVAGGGAAVVGTLVKLAVQRPRPGADLVSVAIQLSSYSFPSGHVVYYTAFFGFLVFLTFTLFKPSPGRLVVLITFTALILLIGLSRIYLGNHWASDVTGAYLFGSLWLAASVSLYQWGKPRFFARQPLAPEVPAAEQA